MNICLLNGDMTRSGGTERMTACLANELCKQHKVWIIGLSSNHGSIPFFQLSSAINYLSLDNNSSKFSVLKKIQSIHSIIEKNKIDILINVDIGCCIFGIPASYFSKTKVITWEHSNFYNNWNSKTFPYFRKYAAKCSDALVVLTETDKKNYETNINTRKPIYAISNPIEKKAFQYDDNSKIIISAGGLSSIKRFDLAIEVAKLVLPNHPDWKWVIYGDGPERNKIENKIKEYHLEKQVLLPGLVTDLNSKYQESSIYVMTSKMEGLPMVLLEAKSYGLPIISFDIMTGPSDIVRDGINGYLIPDNDLEMMSYKIEELINSKELRMKMCNASQLDMEKFDMNYIIYQWESIFNSLKR